MRKNRSKIQKSSCLKTMTPDMFADWFGNLTIALVTFAVTMGVVEHFWRKEVERLADEYDRLLKMWNEERLRGFEYVAKLGELKHKVDELEGKTGPLDLTSLRPRVLG